MELSTYISTTITEVMKGVSKASKTAEKLGGSVNPPALGNTRSTGDYDINDLVFLDFDVAVVVTESKSGGAGAKLSVLGVGGKGDLSLERIHKESNRLKFIIPVQLPTGKKLAAFTRVPYREKGKT